MAAQPPQIVLRAFDLDDLPQALAGGRGLCFRAGNVVLRPSDNDAEAEWVGHLTSELLDNKFSKTYRLARPLKSNIEDCQFVYRSWTAAEFQEGQAMTPVPWRELLHVCRHFHEDIEKLELSKPDFLATMSDRFHEADSVTWDEKSLNDVDLVSDEVLLLIQPALARLQQLKRPIVPEPVSQIIHGDLTGNVLFDPNFNSPPCIIDMTVYWRPAAYAEAIIVADGLLAHGQDKDFAESFMTNTVRMQLLVRAIYWRCLCFAIDPLMEFVSAHLPKMDFNGAICMVESIANSNNEL